jgi:hypothetical protein
MIQKEYFVSTVQDGWPAVGSYLSGSRGIMYYNLNEFIWP